MLVNLKSFAAAVVLGTVALTATSVAAREHQIMILGDSYFPRITYVNPGDTLRFINISEAPHMITAKNDAWTTGELGIEEEFILPVEQGMQNAFYGDAEMLIEGILNFGPAPLN